MTPKKERALLALLSQPTKLQAAQAAGVNVKTLRRYLEDPEFQSEYRRAITSLVDDAASQAKQSLNPALACLREIVEDDEQGAFARIQAARSLLEFGLRLTEITDILRTLEKAEAGSDVL